MATVRSLQILERRAGHNNKAEEVWNAVKTVRD